MNQPLITLTNGKHLPHYNQDKFAHKINNTTHLFFTSAWLMQSLTRPSRDKGLYCGYNGIYSPPHALALYVHFFDLAPQLDKLQAFTPHDETGIYHLARKKLR